jgi:hypothetical protein
MKNLLTLAIFLGFYPSGVSGAVTQLFNSSGLVLENDFENSLISSSVIFDSTVVTGLAFQSSGGVTTSGAGGALDTFANAPMEGTLTVPAIGIGFWFGNNDFGAIFQAVLSVYSGASFLGSVTVTSNGNDYVDQFIGLSSDTAFDRFVVTYQRPQAGLLDVFIDDLHLASVPEPSSLAFFGASGFLLLRRRVLK